ncbi:hypothetical protein TSUD_242960 [Trifolium subterraneum]|uniref:Uncharacterized protein n=1 Tax=Trifolium subterraneum TaxID=3900 RepID=A0A2Z6NWK9_TRISU|nr:hypothetical protein TSUD_242960 [Trifolium subterraneum]
MVDYHSNHNLLHTLFEHQIYTRGADVPDILGTTDRSLTLNGSDYSCHPDYGYLPLCQSRVDVNLFDQTNSIFARISFSLDDDIDDDNYEQVKSMVVPCQQGSLTLQYIAIPFGVHCRLDVTIPECVLFKKQDTEFEQVESCYVKLSRCWVSSPAYSYLIIEVDLSEFGSVRKIHGSHLNLLDEMIIKCHRFHKHKPWSSTAVEIFSVFIGQEKSKAMALDDCSSLKMKFDIKDIEGCLAIKGYVDWPASTLDSYLWYEKQLCSLIQGQHGGFAAIHFSIFDGAVRVTIKVLLNLKTGSFDVNPKIGECFKTVETNDYLLHIELDWCEVKMFNEYLQEVQDNEEYLEAIGLGKTKLFLNCYNGVYGLCTFVVGLIITPIPVAPQDMEKCKSRNLQDAMCQLYTDP